MGGGGGGGGGKGAGVCVCEVKRRVRTRRKEKMKRLPLADTLTLIRNTCARVCAANRLVTSSKSPSPFPAARGHGMQIVRVLRRGRGEEEGDQESKQEADGTLNK